MLKNTGNGVHFWGQYIIIALAYPSGYVVGIAGRIIAGMNWLKGTVA